MTLLVTDFWDPNIMDLIKGIKDLLPNDNLVGVAKMVSATLGLLYLSIRAYAMIIGEGKFEIMQLFRPFVITLAILNFGIFVQIVGKPGEMAGNAAEEKFSGNAKVMNELLESKENLTKEVWDKILENTAEVAEMYKNKDVSESTANIVSLGMLEALDNMGAKLTVYEQLFWSKISMWFQNMITWIVMGIFKGVCYALFFLQLILMHVLLVLGPLSLAFSIGGAFKDSWVHWTARYISVSLYSCIGFIILNIATAIINYGFQQEISRLQQIINKSNVQEQFLSVVQHTDNFIGYLLIALVVALGGVMSVPTISTWVIHTSGAGNAFFGTAVGTVRATSAAASKTLK